MKKVKNVKQASRLTGALLARKGAAAPSSASLLLNQQVLNRFPAPEIKSPVTDNKESAVKAQQPRGLSEKKRTHSVEGEVSTGKSDTTKSLKKPAAGKRIAMTLRMEEEDHLNLRLFSAHTRKSCQVIISEALDCYLRENSDKIPLLKVASQNG